MHAITYRQCNKKKFARMKEILQSGAIKVLSLDVFDTLLMRCRHSELQRFMDMGKIWHKKFPAISADSFYAARALAHRIAYQSQISVQGCREPQASAIFKCMCSILHLAEEDADTLAAMELEYEAAHLRLNPAVGELIRIAKEQNVKVIAVSDMYWKSDAIRQLIEKVVGETLRMDRVYSSSDTGISKSSGLLFDYVLKEEQCTSSAMLHIGDNKESDCVRPYLRHGINAVWIPRPDHYNHYCKKQQKKYMKQLKKRGIINGL
jgi:predicted HAD superfamily hydrolase